MFGALEQEILVQLPVRVARWYSFKIQNSYFGIFCRALEETMLVYFVAIWNLLQPFAMFHGHLVYFVVIRKIFPSFGML
jgi:cellulose synthase/poly-beta-1,6-N-acetylglucosamine synthase-like glycosyltransferase